MSSVFSPAPKRAVGRPKRDLVQLSVQQVQEMSELQAVFDESFNTELEREIAYFDDNFYFSAQKNNIYIISKSDQNVQYKLEPCYKTFSVSNVHRQIVRSPDPNVEPATEVVNAFEVWVSRAKRYTTPVFSPRLPSGSTPVDSVFHRWNHWRGVSVHEARQGDMHTSLLKFIEEIICANNQKAFYWKIQFLADMVQNPGRNQDKVIVLRGDPGSGKGTLLEFLQDLFGLLGQKASFKSFFGDFNFCLEGKLFVYLDEQMWSGERSPWNQLKDRTGSPVIQIERKGMDAYNSDRFFRLFMATNEDWAAPIEKGNRRLVIFDVDSKRVGDYQYFESLRKDWENGGRENFLYYLQNLKITENFAVAPIFSVDAHSKAVEFTELQQHPGIAFLMDDYQDGCPILKIAHNGWIEKKVLFSIFQTWRAEAKVFGDPNRNKFYSEVETFFEVVPRLGVYGFKIDYSRLLKAYPHIANKRNARPSPVDAHDVKMDYKDAQEDVRSDIEAANTAAAGAAS